MILSKTPFRISMFGGGTDYPAYYNEHGGAVIGFTIDKFCHISVRRLPPFFQHRHRIVYSKIELVQSAAEIQHPTARAILQDLIYLIQGDGLEIHHFGDLPARAGLGSSSSFTVGLLNAIYALYGPPPPNSFLAQEAIRIEQKVVGETVGSQDQTFAACGDLMRIDFSASGITPSLLIIPQGREAAFLSRLMLFFTGTTRNAPLIAQAQALRARENLLTLRRMREMVDEAEVILTDPERSIDDLGPLLDEAWQRKRSLSSLVTTQLVDRLYAAAMASGASGGKLLGAGGGGFLLLFVQPEHRRSVKEAMGDLVEVPIGISRHGSRIESS